MKTQITSYALRLTKLSLVFFFMLSLSSCIGDPINVEPEVLTVISDFPGNDAVTVDKKGNVFVSEYGAFVNTGGSGTRIMKISRNGEVSEFVNGLIGPLGNAIDKQGNFYVNNANNLSTGEVTRISPDGDKQVVATIEGWPTGLALDQQSNIYVTNFITPTVHKITQNGTVSVYATDSRLAGGVGVDFDRRGNLIVGNFSTADILSIDRNGNVELVANIPDIVFGGFGIGYITVVGDFVFATGLAVNKIFKVSLRNGEIEVFAGTGEALTVDGTASEASFNGPNGISADKLGKALYISEFGGSGAIRKIVLH